MSGPTLGQTLVGSGATKILDAALVNAYANTRVVTHADRPPSNPKHGDVWVDEFSKHVSYTFATWTMT